MRRVAKIAVAALLLVAGVAGCAGGPAERPQETGGGSSGMPPKTMPPSVPEPRAPGLTDLPDGRVQALGRLARIDLEGGFWAIVGSDGTAEGTSGIVAVIANADAWEKKLWDLEGSVVIAVGRRFEGVSIRMAGPEIVVEELYEAGTVPGKPK